MTEYLYQIGILTRSHGIRGEVAMNFTDDVWDRADADYVFLKLDGLFVPFFLEEWRFRSDDCALVKFEDIDNKDAAERLAGSEVWFPKALTPDTIEDDELTWKMFTGYEVIDVKDSTHIGTITDVDDSTANILFTITPSTLPPQPILVPAHEEFIREADHQQRVVFMDIPDEILHLNE